MPKYFTVVYACFNEKCEVPIIDLCHDCVGCYDLEVFSSFVGVADGTS